MSDELEEPWWQYLVGFLIGVPVLGYWFGVRALPWVLDWPGWAKAVWVWELWM
ncbi:MAG TPA: hypothetical protein VJA25_00955 [Dehalococcoidia bacterium]|nr:hypothetical protein [Dehalococcoidia bacterium]